MTSTINTHWNEGYVTDTDYTYGYYADLNPHHATIPLLMAGVALPEFKNACELGFGQGVSVNIHAAASETDWHANDFNPNQVSFAQNLAEESGAQLNLTDDAFATFCKRTDLPDFDYIGLHGIWSWISDENRAAIVEFIAKKLKIGGVLYISYNVLPGWSAHAPIRHIFTQYDKNMTAQGGSVEQRVKESIDFAKKLFAVTHGLNQQAPQIKQRIDKIATQNPNYLAHEYFNDAWQPMYFSDMANWLSPAKVSFLCATDFTADYKAVNFSNDQLELLKDIHNVSLHQTMVDYLLNRQFRKDYWVKGARKLTSDEKLTQWQRLNFLLVTKVDKISLNIGRGTLKSEIYDPYIQFLGDHQIHDFDELYQVCQKHNMNVETLYEVLAILHSKGDVKLIINRTPSKKITQQCKQLNQYIIELNNNHKPLGSLASPLTAGAISIDHITQMLLAGYKQGNKPEDWAKKVWEVLKKQKRSLVVDGKTLNQPEENIKELEKRAHHINDHLLNIYRRLEIID